MQFPFTDLRGFVPALVPRIPAPSWPAPIISEEFVRSFGVVRERRKGGLAGWIAESEYCEAKHALMFSPGSLGRLKGIPRSAAEIPLSVCFRRLYFDGYALGKVDVGLRTPRLPIVTSPLESFIARVLTVPATVRMVNGQNEQYLLCKAGKPIAQLYAYATSKVVHNLAQGALTSIVRSEAPILFIEMDRREANRVDMPHYAREIPISAEHGVELLFWRNNIQGNITSVWCTIGDRISSNLNARSLRIYLLRLNAEHQTLKRVLKAVGAGEIAPKPRDGTANFLQNYFNIATRRISRCEMKGRLYSSELDALAFSLFDIAAPGQRDSLMERLHLIDVRANICRKIDDYAAKQTTYIKHNTGVIYVTGNETYNIIDSANVNIKAKLTNVQQTAGAIAAGNDLQKTELQDLLKQLTDILEKVPFDKAEDAETIAAQAGQLVEAAAKDKPSRSMLQVIGNGLKEAASFLKDVAPAAVTIAGQIVSLIGKIHGFPL